MPFHTTGGLASPPDSRNNSPTVPAVPGGSSSAFNLQNNSPTVPAGYSSALNLAKLPTSQFLNLNSQDDDDCEMDAVEPPVVPHPKISKQPDLQDSTRMDLIDSLQLQGRNDSTQVEDVDPLNVVEPEKTSSGSQRDSIGDLQTVDVDDVDPPIEDVDMDGLTRADPINLLQLQGRNDSTQVEDVDPLNVVEPEKTSSGSQRDAIGDLQTVDVDAVDPPIEDVDMDASSEEEGRDDSSQKDMVVEPLVTKQLLSESSSDSSSEEEAVDGTLLAEPFEPRRSSRNTAKKNQLSLKLRTPPKSYNVKRKPALKKGPILLEASV
jgi:hypothetical protein